MSVNTTEILTVKEAAEFFKCHPSSIYRLLTQNALPAFKIGSDWRFRREALEQWIANGGSLDDVQEVRRGRKHK